MTVYSLNNTFYDSASQILSNEETQIHLPSFSANLFLCLIEQYPKFATYQELIDNVWEGIQVSEDNLKQRVSILRKSLKPFGLDKNVVAVRGMGYKISGVEVKIKRSRHPFNISSVGILNLAAIIVLVIAVLSFVYRDSSSTQQQTEKTTSLANYPAFYKSVRIFKPLNEDSAFCLDGIDDYLVVPHDNGLNVHQGEFSFAAWVKTTGTNTLIIADKRYEDRNLGTKGYAFFVHKTHIGIQLAEGNGYWFCDLTKESSCTNYWGQKELNDNHWHYLVATIKRNTSDGIKLYVDGKLDSAFDSFIRIADIDTVQPLRIGKRASNNSGYFSGGIGLFALYNYVLSDDEIASTFNEGFTATCTPRNE